MDASDLRLDDFVQQTSELDLSVTPPPSLVTSTVFAVDTTPRAVPRSLELLSSSSNVLGALASAQLGRAHEALSASATATPPSSTSDLQAVAIVSASEARAHTSGKVSASSSTAERHADGGDVQQKEEELRRISKLAQLLGADTDKDIKASRRQLKLLCMLDVCLCVFTFHDITVITRDSVDNNVHNRTDLLSSIDHILSQEKDIAVGLQRRLQAAAMFTLHRSLAHQRIGKACGKSRVNPWRTARGDHEEANGAIVEACP